jgi:hypothetical protein
MVAQLAARGGERRVSRIEVLTNVAAPELFLVNAMAPLKNALEPPSRRGGGGSRTRKFGDS